MKNTLEKNCFQNNSQCKVGACVEDRRGGVWAQPREEIGTDSLPQSVDWAGQVASTKIVSSEQRREAFGNVDIV